MIRFIRELRLVPIALVASACLLALKTADFMFDQGYFGAADSMSAGDDDASVIRTTPDVVQHSGSGLSWARQMFNFPDGSDTPTAAADAPPPPDNGGDITGSVPTPAAADAKSSDDSGKGDKSPPNAVAAPATAAGATTATATTSPPTGRDGPQSMPPPGTVIPLNGPGQISGAERAILDRLQQRREELDARSRELDIRESLIKEAERRMDAKLTEIKETESKIAAETQQRDDADNARLKSLVTMYENMKPRDAAKIFDRLEIPVLLQVASLIKPQQMAEIMAQTSPDTAEKLTVELASKAQPAKPDDGPPELPKIVGQPTTP
jgi:flagellar motility protein MotE (MotC chaperone)